MCTVKTQECIGALRRVCMKRTQGSETGTVSVGLSSPMLGTIVEEGEAREDPWVV